MSALWDWTLAAYGRAGAPEACLRLQDQHGQNTSYLLWAAWGGIEDAALLARAAETARAWDRAVLHPLRQTRRDLKAPRPPVDDAVREGLREDVKAAELRAERVLMETLEALGGTGADKAPASVALAAAARAWGPEPPAEALADLARALG
jgi:uncharacterized protein (TIGR02444 family)